MKKKVRTESTPGVKPSGGVKRRILYPFMLDPDEYEYLVRAARAYRKNGKITTLLRDKIFKSGWRYHLVRFRQSQGANLK